MHKTILNSIAILVMLALCASAFAAPEASVSEKQPLAIFALGYYGYDIPSETLGSLDARIVEVFTNMKRFEVMGFEQRLKTSDISKFIADLKKYKEENLVLPEKYILGEAFLTEADLNKLIGAFVIVMPVVTNFDVKYQPAVTDKTTGKTSKPYWKCEMEVAFTFQDVARSVTMAAPILKVSGTSEKGSNEAIRSALESIPGILELKAREVFPLDSKVVSANLAGVKMRLGSGMGVKKGYEFMVIDKQEIDGIVDESEAGLVVVNKVTKEFSDATILYSSIPLSKETQLREYVRSGVDISPYTSVMLGASAEVDGIGNEEMFFAPGLKITVSEGFYDFKPIFAVQTYYPGIAASANITLLPLSVLLGGEFNLYIRRLQIAPFVAVGANAYYVDLGTSSEGDFYLSHVGGSAGLTLSFLLAKNFKLYVEPSGQYWYSLVPNVVSYFYGYGGSLGLTIKL